MRKLQFIVFGLILLFGQALFGSIINIPDDYPTIQQGIDASVNGDTVLVQPGTYFENIQIWYKSITVGSLFLTTQDTSYISQTIIDGNQNGSVVIFMATISSVLIGFKITNGQGSSSYPYYGGGINCGWSNIVLKNLIISGNNATYGGGIYCYYSSNLTLENVAISRNSASWYGGGITCVGGSNITFNDSNRCNIFFNNAGCGNDLYYSRGSYDPPLNLIVDTFTVLQLDEHFAYPINDFTFDILNCKVEPINQDLYVSPDGNDDNSGLTVFEPLKTISWTLTKIVSDSTHPNIIHLANGIYSPSMTGERFPLNCRSYVSIIGENEDLTILDGDAMTNYNINNSHISIIYCSNDNNLTLKYLTITNGSSSGSPYYNGGVVKILSSNITVENVKIYNNIFVPEDDYCWNGAIYCGGSSPIFINVMIYGNYCAYWASSGFESRSWGILCRDSNPIFTNITIFGNGSAFYNGGGVYCWNSNPIFTNVIICGNHGQNTYYSSYSSGICCDWNSNPILLNCILWDNWPCQINMISDSVIANYSDIQGGWSGNGNIDTDPLFVNPQYDFRLTENSPCIDSGNPDTMYYDPEDPNNPGYALYPAMGTIINDMGAFGGPEAFEWSINPKIFGFIYDSENRNPIENATVYATGNYYSLPTNELGGYTIYNVPFGYGYHLYAYASGYELNEITGVDVTTQNPFVTVDIELTPITGDYELVDLDPNPNPAISTIMQGGTVHRYYLIRDENTHTPGVGIEVGVESGININTFYSNDKGIVDINYYSSEIGNGQSGDTENYSIISINGEPISPTIDFTCEVMNPVYGKYWDSNEFGKLGLSFFSVEFERGSSTKLIENDPAELDAELISITRQARAGVGVEFGVGVGAGVQCGNIYAGVGASAGVGGNISVVTEDYYQFPHQDYNDWEALAQYILVADGNFGNLDNTLIRFLSLLEEYFTNQTTLQDAYLGDKKGIDVCVSASASANIGIGVTDLMGIGAGANIGTEGHALFNIIHHYDSNENEYDFGVSGTLTASASGGLMLDIPINENWSMGLGGMINIFDYDGTRGMQFSVFKDNDTNNFTKFQLKFLHRKEYQGWEEVVTYTIFGDDVYNAIESVMTQVEILCNPTLYTENITVPNYLFSQLINSIFQILYDLQTNQQGEATISFQKDRKNISHISSFEINIGISLTSAVSAQIGGGIGFEEGKTKVKENGKWIWGNHLVLEEYGDYIPNIPEEYQNVLQEIVDTVPLWIRILLGLINIFIPGKDDATFYVGDTGSYIIFTDGSIPPEIDSITCVSWSWYGSSPGKNLSDVSVDKRIIYIKNRSRAERVFGMRYGVGGFYQFEPINTTLLDTCYFTIVYPDSDVVEIDESTLGMYKEDKENHSWIFMGGILDTLNNTVTAPVTELALYTLAPRMPLGEFGLNANPDSIYADSISTTIITSDVIYYNNQTQVVDGELFTVNTEAGAIISTDVDTSLAGIQIEAENGVIELELRSSHIASYPKVSVFSVYGSAEAHTYVTFYDTIPPANPTNLEAVAGNECVYLTWSPNQEDNISGYKIYFDSDQSGPPYEGIATVYGLPSPITIGVDTCYTVTGLYCDTTYYFAITAYDISGNESIYSYEVSATPSEVSADDYIQPVKTILICNYPNPFNKITTIRYFLPQYTEVKIQIYNLKGQLVETIVDSNKPTGYYTIEWNAKDMSSGIYFYKLSTKDKTFINKMILLK